ncbi:kinase-like domain-containing protein [Aspergillus stella-maris]|uniref:kinase-like domain-containing protein n=1 Tax=Aspergillus stella-maris TaxID=1810926 RepID=UPI003CCCFD4C
MTFHSADTLEKHDWVGGGLDATIYRVAPTIAVKTVCTDQSPEAKASGHPFLKKIAFFKRLKEYPIDASTLSNEREKGQNGFRGRLIKVKDYEASALVARWMQQLTSALEHVEKLGFCHNDIHVSNCLLDENFNLKLADVGRASTIGQPLQGVLPPRAMPILAGPLKGTYGLCSARTEQFAVGTLLLFLVYGHEPYDDDYTLSDVNTAEWDRRFGQMEFPQLTRYEVFGGLISACWYNVYPTMALVAYDFERKARHIAAHTEYVSIESAKDTKASKHVLMAVLLTQTLALVLMIHRKFITLFSEMRCALLTMSHYHASIRKTDAPKPNTIYVCKLGAVAKPEANRRRRRLERILEAIKHASLGRRLADS